MKRKKVSILNLIWFTLLSSGLSSCSNDGQESSIPWGWILGILGIAFIAYVAFMVYRKSNPPKHTHGGDSKPVDPDKVWEIVAVVLLAAVITTIVYRSKANKKPHAQATASVRSTPQAYVTTLNTEAYPIILQPGEHLTASTNTNCVWVYTGDNESNGHWEQLTGDMPIHTGTHTYFMFKSCDNVGGILSYTISPTQ